MTTPLSEFAKTYLPGKDIASDGDPIVENIADAGGSITTLVDAAITGADARYDGAIIYFSGDTTTAALQGHFAHVRTWLNSTKTFTFAKDLPAIPVAGDTYQILFGGLKRSSQEAFGLLGGNVQPELAGIVGSNITGLTLIKFAGKLGEGTLTIEWTQATSEIEIKMDAEPLGAPYVVSGDATDQYVYADDGQSFVKFDVVQASLPGTDQTDTHTLVRPNQTLTPDYEGYETLSDNGGKTRYRLEVVRNEDGSNSMLSTTVRSSKPSGSDTTIDTGETIDLTKSTFDVVDATGWPTKAFWVLINDGFVEDCRYIIRRSGNTLTAQKVDWMVIPFDAGEEEPLLNEILDNDTSGATAVIDQVFVTSGSFVGNDAAGTLLVKKVVGTFSNNDVMSIGATQVALVDGTGTLGLRGFDAASHTAGTTVKLMGDIDLGLETPAGGDTYDNPDVETLNPDGVTFALADVVAKELGIGTLATNVQHGVWRREWIMDEAESREDIDADTVYSWS